MDWRAPVIACVLFVVAFFVQVLFWVYVGAGVFLLAAVFVRDRSVARGPVGVDARVLGSGRMRRFMRKANVGGSRFWWWLPSRRVLVGFVGVSVVALLVGAVIGASVANTARIRSTGKIRVDGVQVYSDAGLSQVLTELSWGTLAPGETRTLDAWVKNTGNSPQQLLMWTESWDSVAAQNSISFSWNYGNEWVPAGGAVAVTFTLSVDPDISGVEAFIHDVVVQGVS